MIATLVAMAMAGAFCIAYGGVATQQVAALAVTSLKLRGTTVKKLLSGAVVGFAVALAGTLCAADGRSVVHACVLALVAMVAVPVSQVLYASYRLRERDAETWQQTFKLALTLVEVGDFAID